MARSIICLIFLSFSLLGGKINAERSQSTTPFNERKITPPEREVAIIIAAEGHYPKNIVAFKGEKVRIFLTTTLPKESCFSVPSKDVFLSVKRGEISEGILFFNEPGTYEFNCPTGKIKGTITVLNRRVTMASSIDSSEEVPQKENTPGEKPKG